MGSKSRFSSTEQDARRDDVRVGPLEIEGIQTMGREQLLVLQAALGFGATWGVIDIPKHFMPSGSFQKLSKRVIDFRNVAAACDLAILAVTRFAILRWLTPIGQASRPCTASTLADDLSTLRRVLKHALSKESDDPARVWSRISQDELDEICPPTGKRNFGRVFETLSRRGLLDDSVQITARSRVDRFENKRSGLASLKSKSREVRPYVALPDAFVSECGWRCIWLIKTLGPLVAEAIELSLDKNHVDREISKHSALKKFRSEAKQRLVDFQWRDELGQPVVPPFNLHLQSVDEKGHGQRAHLLRWPPKSLPDLWRLAWLLQAAHAFVVGLSGGPREGELLSLTKEALVEDSGGWRIRGKTFKLVFREDGEFRDWPAPKICVTSIEQQVRLANLAHRAAAACGCDTGGPQLWVLFPISEYATSGSPMNSIGSSFRGLVRMLGLDHLLPDEDLRERTLHAHRLRKTTGRLVGLALTNGLQVLMDLYGHEDPEMTVGYLLSNKDIAEEAQAVAEAQTIMFAAQAITDADSLGGKAAARIRDEVTC